MASRGSFASKFGVLMATVGSAVGLGNIWRFPYQMADNGGDAFLLMYVICVFLMGVPAMVAEFIIGRHTHRNAVGAFESLAPKTSWTGVGYLGVFTGFIIDCYYCVVTGWTLYYLYKSVTGSLLGGTMDSYAQMFSAFAADTWLPIILLIVVVIITCGILVMGVQKGIENVSKVLLPMLFVTLIILAVNSCLMPGALDGLKFMFVPSKSNVTLFTFLDAAGQAFFSLSIGMGALITYSSYFDDNINITKTATQIAVIDLLVAVVSSLIIFPAVFTFGAEPEQGPGLVFKVLPSVFTQMKIGWLWSVMFYLLLFIAALTSFLSITEVVVAYASETFNLKRLTSSIIIGAIFVVIGSVTSLSFGPLKDYTLFDMTIFELMDYLASNILLPVGSVLISVFVGWRLDRKVVASQLKVESPKQYKLLSVYIFFLRYIVPVTVGGVFASQFFS